MIVLVRKPFHLLALTRRVVVCPVVAEVVVAGTEAPTAAYLDHGTTRVEKIVMST